MPIDIGEVSSTVRVVDGDALVSPAVLERIVQAVIAAMRDSTDRDQRASAERRITGGVSTERDEGR